MRPADSQSAVPTTVRYVLERDGSRATGRCPEAAEVRKSGEQTSAVEMRGAALCAPTCFPPTSGTSQRSACPAARPSDRAPRRARKANATASAVVQSALWLHGLCQRPRITRLRRTARRPRGGAPDAGGFHREFVERTTRLFAATRVVIGAREAPQREAGQMLLLLSHLDRPTVFSLPRTKLPLRGQLVATGDMRADFR